MTPDEVKAFQQGPPGGSRPVDFLGVPLNNDGDLGAKTRWAMDLATLPLWRQNVVRNAVAMHGRRENGVNRGAWIDAMMRACRLDPDVDGAGASEDGHPWCGAFACWHLGNHSPYPFTRDASVRRLTLQLREVTPERALPGDLAAVLYPGGVKGHVGILVARSGGWSASCDGNLGNMVRTVRYRTEERRYLTVEPQVICPAVPMALPEYAGSTR